MRPRIRPSLERLLASSVTICVAVGGVGCDLVLGIEPLSRAKTTSSSTGAGGATSCTENCPPTVSSTLGLGSTGPDVVTHVALAPDGGVAVIGSLGGTIELGGAGTGSGESGDMFVLRLDASGNAVFSHAVPDCLPVGVAFDPSGRVVVAGNCTGSIQVGGVDEPLSGAFIVGFDAAGAGVFGRAATTTSGVLLATDLAVGADGRIALVGGFGGSVDFRDTSGAAVSDGAGDVFVMLLDGQGKDVWKVRTFGAGMGTVNGATAATFAGPGELVVTGRKQGPLKMDATVLTGQVGSFLARFDATGNVTKAQTFPGAFPSSIAPGPAASVIVSGVTIAEVVFGGVSLALNEQFVARFDAADAATFVRGLGTLQSPTARFDAAGDVLVAGSFSGELDLSSSAASPAVLASAGGSDAALVKLGGSDGTTVWTARYGGVEDDVALDVAVDTAVAPSRLVFVGSFSGAFSLAGLPLAAAGASDLWITTLSP